MPMFASSAAASDVARTSPQASWTARLATWLRGTTSLERAGGDLGPGDSGHGNLGQGDPGHGERAGSVTADGRSLRARGAAARRRAAPATSRAVVHPHPGASAPVAAEGGRRASRVLILQGPAGPFFRHLAEAFGDLGYETDRVRFDAGDRFFAPGRGSGLARRLDYRGGAAMWPEWLRERLSSGGYRMIVLFGSERPQHMVAREVAGELGVPVVSLELGYVRPGFVAVERGGNDWRSPMAGRIPPAALVARARHDENDAALAPPDRLTGHGFSWSMVWGALFFGWRNLATHGRQRQLFHKSRPTHRELPLWLRNYARWLRGTGERPETLIERYRGRYDLVPLQVHDDSQLGDAGAGWNNARLVTETIASFARHAPKDRHLVIKAHPLERGHTNDHKLVARRARELGVADRVHCILSGPFAELARNARGVILINSSSGISAIAHGTPILTLGEAVYRNPALVRCGRERADIDAFWTDDFVGDATLRKLYVPWLIRNALIPGDFYDPAVARQTAANVARRAREIAEGTAVETIDGPVTARALQRLAEHATRGALKEDAANDSVAAPGPRSDTVAGPGARPDTLAVAGDADRPAATLVALADARERAAMADGEGAPTPPDGDPAAPKRDADRLVAAPRG